MDTPLRKRQKVSSACKRCRERKLGCDKERPCLLCVRAGAECIPRDRSSVDVVASSSNETRSRRSSSSRHVNPPVETGSPVLPESNIVDLSALMIRDNGPSLDLDHDTSALPGGRKLVDPALVGIKQWRKIAGVELPPDDVLDHFIDVFFASVDWFMMVFHEDAFRRRYEDVSRREQIRYQDSTFYWTCLLVIALGAHYSALKTPEDPRSAEYRQLSRDLIAVIEARFLHISGCSTVETVKMCVLLGSFIFYTRPTTGLGICGMGVKIAQVIGLHRESLWKDASPLVREERRRTWWALEVFDKYAAVAFGRPCIIDDSDCQVDMVSDIELDGRVHLPARPLILYHQHKFRLYRIMGAFLGRKRRANRLDSIETIHQQMLQWRQELPDVLTLDGDHGELAHEAVIPTQIHALSLQLTYDNLQIILHRSAAFDHDVTRGGIRVSSSSSSISLQQILASAINTSELYRHPAVLDAARRTHADIHVGITMFTAGVVLCAICLSQPLTDMGSRAKTGVMHIIRMCQETSSLGHQLISKQSLSVLDNLVTVMLRQETDLIMGRTSLPTINKAQLHETMAVKTAASASGSELGTHSGPGGISGGGLLHPIQEVFASHVSRGASASSTPVAMQEQAAPSTGNMEAPGDLVDQSSFEWDGDMAYLVDSGLADASQMWLWADSLSYESFNDPGWEPPS